MDIHLCYYSETQQGLPRWRGGKESTCQCRRHRRHKFDCVFLGWEDPLEKEMATCCSILAWEIPWTEESSGLQAVRHRRVRHNWVTKHSPSKTQWRGDSLKVSHNVKSENRSMNFSYSLKFTDLSCTLNRSLAPPWFYVVIHCCLGNIGSLSHAHLLNVDTFCYMI